MKTEHKRQLVIFGVVALLFCAGGIVSVGFGVGLYQDNRAFAQKAKPATGHVVDYKKVVRGTGQNPRKDVTYYVIVEYTTQNGETMILDDVPEVKNDPDREARKSLPA